MPHAKTAEQELAEMHDRLGEIAEELPQTATGDTPARKLAEARNAIKIVKTDLSRWREYYNE